MYAAIYIPNATPRDSAELAEVAKSFSPLVEITAADIVAGDDDGVLFLPADRAAEIFTAAEAIRDTERHQADLIRGGMSLRSQVGFAAYLAARTANPDLTFREHLRTVGGEIEV